MYPKQICLAALAATMMLIALPATGQPRESSLLFLTSGWEFRWERGVGSAGSAEPWRPIPELLNPSGRQGRSYGSYRVQLPAGVWVHPSLYIPGVATSFELFVNDTLRYTSGRMEPSPDNKYNDVMQHLVPLTQSDMGSIIHLRIFSETESYFGILDSDLPVTIGSDDAIIRHILSRNIDTLILGSLLVFVGCFSLFIFLMRFRSRDASILSFGVFTLFAGLFYVNINVLTEFLSGLAVARYYLSNLGFLLFPVGAYAFVEHIVRREYRPLLRGIWQAHLAFAVIAAVLDISGLTTFVALRNFVQIFFAITLVITFGVCMQSARSGNPEARLLLAGFAIAGLSGLNDIFMALGWIPQWQWISAYGSFIFIIFLGFILERRFTSNARKLELYSRELEFKTRKLDKYSQILEATVAERTADLNRKNAELTETLEKLTAAQSELITQAKLASLGSLVAGLAHEINNPIGAVQSAVDVLKRCARRIDEVIRNHPSSSEIAAEPRLRQAMDLLEENNRVIGEASRRISHLVDNLKRFALLDEADVQKIDLHEGIDSALVLLEHELKDRIRVEREYGNIPEVFCHASQIHQVIMSVLKNAAQAIRDRGEIHIRTDAFEEGVLIAIADTGVGIEEERLQRIFEIGFSREGSRVKLGSGLSTAHHIIRRHGGRISVDSVPGEGTCVSIYVPAALQDAAQPV